MSNLPTKEIKQQFLSFAKQIQAINPKLDSLKFMAEVYHEYDTNEGLQKCTPNSILLCAKTAAQHGLMVGKNFGLAWIVPYWNNKLRCNEAQFQLGYKGMIMLAARAGITIYPPACIYENDKYKIDGCNNVTKHERLLGKSRGAPLAYYVKAKNQYGEIVPFLMEMDEIYKRKDQSLAKIKDEFKKYSPWVVWEHEMCLKTVVRGLFKYLAVDEDLRQVVEQEERDITSETEIVDAAPVPTMQDQWYLKDKEPKVEIANQEFKEISWDDDNGSHSVDMKTGEIIHEIDKEQDKKELEAKLEVQEIPEHKKAGMGALEQAKSTLRI